MRHFAHLTLLLLIALLALAPAAPGRAQDASVFPLPADLYILTSENRVLRIDATTGEQTPVSPEGQPVAAFDVAPGGGWYAYRTLDNNAVIVASLSSMSGFVVEFDQPLQGAGERAIAWSPDGTQLAYTVPEGVRVAALTEIGMGEVATALIEGAWTGVYWADARSVIATSADGSSARLSAGEETWRSETETAPPAPVTDMDATLTPEGVQLDDGRIVPSTAGALAFDWRPLPLPALPEGILPAALYFLAEDDAGIAQVWELPASGEAPRPVTASSQPVLDYVVAAQRVAYVTASELGITALDGSMTQSLATLTSGRVRPTVSLNDDASQVAFSDDRGLWTVSTDGSQPPRQVVQNALTDDPATVRAYMDPMFNREETRLLVRIGLYEGSILGVVDLADGAVTELPTAVYGLNQWAEDGRIIAGSAATMYSTPGLYLLDPETPDAEPVTLVGMETPVFDARQSPDGTWTVIAGESGSSMGPQRVHLLSGRQESGIIPAYGEDTGAFMEQPVLAPAGALDAPTLAAGLRNVTYEMDGVWGEPVVADLSTGEVWAIPAPGPASTLMWAH